MSTNFEKIAHVARGMLKDPSKKYKPFQGVHLPNRQWPGRVITKAPRWLSTDLRDGNQALPDPMNGEEKLKYFKLLCNLGFKEIEVGFPSASQTDFAFVRHLVETPGLIPEDVTISALSPSREHLINRTIEALRGSKNATLHLYNAVSPLFRDVVFRNSRQETLELAKKGARAVTMATKHAAESTPTNWGFQYSPETFSDAEPDFSLEVCEAVKSIWNPSTAKPIIFNLPATVEMSTPNTYADLIEYFSTKISEREKVCVSLHPHNDRGTAVAAAELGQLAGADRVEGCLFGNGERTGNVDLVTLAFNLYTQGVSPNLDFSKLDEVIRITEACNKINVHPRHPYAGNLVFTAFSGSHQDAISKGLRAYDDRKNVDPTWKVPYLPLDPHDVNSEYAAIIRVNSQSGKGGVAYLLKTNRGLDLPRALQVEFGAVVKDYSDNKGKELTIGEISDLFNTTYFLEFPGRFSLDDYTLSSNGPRSKSISCVVDVKGKNAGRCVIEGSGNGPMSAVVDAMRRQFNIAFDIGQYSEHAIGSGNSVKAASYVEIKCNNNSFWGVGIDDDVTSSGLKAVMSAISRAATEVAK
ncbi:2-isopropylmalate synthase [Schizosaccharomyces octosporus yFS286]|uniref:2-isopropylmalate synthase n=1 Tax=Schizosaccharomyces octosporus (strain yFS286) TaxID=483514 RepID=S9R754_SCHOY|nr:2-isopropylmalate synthase [Schizosaccharomyces octosporus yFS286]EPX74065.1 2-isopropylmalate synthase [Schizosaccharomyces octosporus yFS286]